MKRVFFLLTLLLAASAALAQTTGTWQLYPAQSQTAVNQVTVQQPINPDGTSVWSATKGVVPVQFTLKTGYTYGPVVFSSIGTSYSYLSFTPNPAITFDQLTSLIANYTFTTGNCHGGALRWSVGTPIGNLFIYYGGEPNTTDCTSSGVATNQSGTNMLGLGDLRYDTSQIGGQFYNTWADAQSLLAGQAVNYVALVLDGGWGGDQVVSLGNVSVNGNTFVPLTTSSLSPTCQLPAANIEVDRLLPTPSGNIDEVAINQSVDQGTAFRVVDCKYMYNLAAKSLGVGQYAVKAIIGGVPADDSGMTQFTLK